MDCRRIQDLILDYFDGALDAEAIRTVEEHTAGCAACREAWEAQRMLDEAFTAPALPQARPGFQQRVLRRIDSAPAERNAAWFPEVLDLLGYSTLIAAGGVLVNSALALPALQGLAANGTNIAIWTAGTTALGYLVWTELKPARGGR